MAIKIANFDRAFRFFFLAVFLAILVSWLSAYIFRAQIAGWAYRNRGNPVVGRLLESVGDPDKPFERYLFRSQKVINNSFTIALFMLFFAAAASRIKNSRPVFWFVIFCLIAASAFKAVNSLLVFIALPASVYFLLNGWLLFSLAVVFLFSGDKKKIIGDCFFCAFSLTAAITIFELLPLKAIPAFPRYLMRYSRWHRQDLNSMGFMDKERSFSNPENKTRILFVGDSYLESWGYSIVPLCQKSADDQRNVRHSEFINLSESDTDPVGYYWRVKNIGVKFNPDVIAVFVCEMNDFIGKDRVIQGLRENRFFAPYPQQSAFCAIFPKTTALFSSGYYYIRSLAAPCFTGPEAWKGMTDKEKELELIKMVRRRTKISSVEAASYVNALSPQTKKFIYDGKYLPDFFFYAFPVMFGGTSTEGNILKPRYAAECIIELKKLLIRHGLGTKIIVFFIPAAEKADPVFLAALQDLYKTDAFPSGPLLNEEGRAAFFNALSREGIEAFDLSEALQGIRSSYLSDGHWSVSGNELVSNYVYAKLRPFLISEETEGCDGFGSHPVNKQ